MNQCMPTAYCLLQLPALTLGGNPARKASHAYGRRCSQVAKAVDCKSTTRGFDSHRRLSFSVLHFCQTSDNK